jgi:hypothetical protein
VTEAPNIKQSSSKVYSLPIFVHFLLESVPAYPQVFYPTDRKPFASNNTVRPNLFLPLPIWLRDTAHKLRLRLATGISTNKSIVAYAAVLTIHMLFSFFLFSLPFS